ncbi:hypothetical protein GJ633_00065 [Halorubrum sp. CBA1125]|uniref:hypothetical protein n=1 Tax=Halorubrum sp. CBA1125 TaxID=2668072 RepID=UPI0012E6FBCE|nr:hypothetical protein [Halorubrum sp. CBA1125]MUW13216.1 hypothetical protein [Halorubrum sp. CBA1125]
MSPFIGELYTETNEIENEERISRIRNIDIIFLPVILLFLILMVPNAIIIVENTPLTTEKRLRVVDQVFNAIPATRATADKTYTIKKDREMWSPISIIQVVIDNNNGYPKCA